MLDKKNRGAIIFLIVLFMVVLLVFIVKYKWDNGIKRPDTDPTALISQTEYTGDNEYTKYKYYIYSEKGIYIYFKTKSTNNSDEEEIEYGRLKEKKDMDKIKKEIENDKEKSIGRTIIYEYYKNGKSIQCDSIDMLNRYLW